MNILICEKCNLCRSEQEPYCPKCDPKLAAEVEAKLVEAEKIVEAKKIRPQRKEPRDSLDDFPTPPFATRALFKYLLSPHSPMAVWSRRDHQSCLEPACNRGFMAEVLEEEFKEVVAKDVKDYGYGDKEDFLKGVYETDSFDWVITNPPFNLSEAFIDKALRVASKGVAVFHRLSFMEGVGRYKRLFENNPPQIVAPFSERVPIYKGGIQPEAKNPVAYAWFVWLNEASIFDTDRKLRCEVKWLPPCRSILERKGDYEGRAPEGKAIEESEVDYDLFSALETGDA